MVEDLEKRLLWTKILSNMRNGDDYQFCASRGIVSVKYERDSLFHAGEWLYRGNRTTNIEDVLSYLGV